MLFFHVYTTLHRYTENKDFTFKKILCFIRIIAFSFQVIRIRESSEGLVDLSHLETTLRGLKTSNTVIGVFGAASNITGVLTDSLAVTVLLHRYGALAFWDYATAGNDF